MRYVRLYALAVYHSWVALLSGIASILLMLVQATMTTPLPSWTVKLAAWSCFVVSMFSVWINELIGKEEAEAKLADAERKRKKSLEIADLIDQGNEFLRSNFKHSGNYHQFFAIRKEWVGLAKDYIAETHPHPRGRPNLAQFNVGDEESCSQEIRDLVTYLEAIRDAILL